MSDADDHQELLQILEAHGQRFLSAFGQSSKPSSSKRKLEQSDDSSAGGEEDEEWHGFGTKHAGSDDFEDGSSVDSSHGALNCLLSGCESAYERRG
jgi:hypothetical protein